MSAKVVGEAVVELNAGAPVVHGGAISRLWVDKELLRSVGGGIEAGCAARSVGDGGVELEAEAVVEDHARRDLPGVLDVGGKCAAAIRRGADVFSVGEVGGRDGAGVGERASGEQGGERVGKGVAYVDVVGSALRLDLGGRVSRSAAEVVLAVG